jgi:hypothetical protein
LFAASSENFTAIGALAAICFRIVSARNCGDQRCLPSARRDDFVDEADAIGFLRDNFVDRLAGEDQLQRAALADQARQRCVPPPPGSSPSLTSGCPNLACSDRDPDRASHRRLAAAAERKAIDGRDHRLAEIFDEIEHTLPEPAGLLRLIGVDMREFADVGAGDEGLVARAGEDHAVHGRVGLCILEGGPQIVQVGVLSALSTLGRLTVT